MTINTHQALFTRTRRTRRTDNLRRLVQETHLEPSSFESDQLACPEPAGELLGVDETDRDGRLCDDRLPEPDRRDEPRYESLDGAQRERGDLGADHEGELADVQGNPDLQGGRVPSWEESDHLPKNRKWKPGLFGLPEVLCE